MDYSPYGPGYNAVSVDDTPTGKYAPMGPWKYFGYQLLFALPVIGFICLIIFSFAGGNINRRNFARSYWCGLLVGIVLIVAAVALLFATGAINNVTEFIEQVMAQM